MSQAAFASAAGISRMGLINIETGTNLPNTSTFFLLHQAAGKSISEYLENRGHAHPENPATNGKPRASLEKGMATGRDSVRQSATMARTQSVPDRVGRLGHRGGGLPRRLVPNRPRNSQLV
jgi:transcriptional regulator with XRE-family HTH domain